MKSTTLPPIVTVKYALHLLAGRICSVLIAGWAGFGALAADPQLTSWLTAYSGQYARVYETDADRLGGTTLTTWPRPGRSVMGGQATATYCGIHEISSSASWVYLRTSGLGSHVMGPWFMSTAHTALFMNMPKNTATIYRFPRSPQPQAGNKTLTGLGPIGIFVDGVVMFDSRDAFSVSAASGTEAPNGLGIWNRDAYVNESQTFDPAFAHQPGSGQYHYHANPPALRYLLGDNISFNGGTKIYTEDSTNTNLPHSPILGWVRDGYPIYGPYGYSNPTNPAGGVRRMISGFVPRNTNNAGVLTRATLPAWAQRAQNRPTLTAAQYGPAVGASFPFGRYLEDNEYLGDLGFGKGADFDLDEYNGRFCVTPEFPAGTYAYFTCISSNGAPVFPYNIGRQFYGVASGGTVSSITESVSTNFVGGPNLPIKLNPPSKNGSSGDVTLTWSSVDGGTYQIEAVSDLPSGHWSVIQSNVSSKGILSDAVESGPSPAGATNRLYRIRRSGLATYDSTGF